MRKGLCFILCTVMWIFAACSPVPDIGNQSDISTELLIESEQIESVLLVSTDELMIERTGNKTAIYDLVAGQSYTFVTKKVMLKKTAAQPIGNILHDTPTLQIKQLKGVLGIFVKSTGEIYLV